VGAVTSRDHYDYAAGSRSHRDFLGNFDFPDNHLKKYVREIGRCEKRVAIGGMKYGAKSG
jgi:hypothetical protein